MFVCWVYVFVGCTCLLGVRVCLLGVRVPGLLGVRVTEDCSADLVQVSLLRYTRVNYNTQGCVIL
jgi:hypothetical protein